MLMDEGMDSGPILDQVTTPIRDDDTLETLHDRLADLGAELLVRVLPLWAYFKLRAKPQDPDQVTMAYKIRKSDGLLHWEDPTVRSLRKLRAYTPWPSCFTYMPEGTREAGRMLKVLAATAQPITVEQERLAPGTVLSADKTGIVVRSGDGAIRLLRVQPEGGKPMDVAAWLCGRALLPGDRFHTPPAPAAKPIVAFSRD